jgi:hypothetical protein
LRRRRSFPRGSPWINAYLVEAEREHFLLDQADHLALLPGEAFYSDKILREIAELGLNFLRKDFRSVHGWFLPAEEIVAKFFYKLY